MVPVVDRWTGREAALLRGALRLSIRDFAAHLGVSTRIINTWEARQTDITQQPHMQAVLDTALSQADDEAKARFAAALHPDPPTAETATPPDRIVQGLLVPVRINGHLVFASVDTDAVTTHGLYAVLEELPAAMAPFLAAARDTPDGSTINDETADLTPDEDMDRGDQPRCDVLVVEHSTSPGGLPPMVAGVGTGPATVEATEVSDTEKVDRMLRRNFSGLASALVLGAGLDALDVEVLDIERLAALVDPDAATSATKAIGAADVEAIEQTTATLRKWQFSSGGGVSRSATVALFQSVLPLRKAASTPAVRERLLIATADLGGLAAWTNYDIERHDDARRLWMTSLSVIQGMESLRATDLTMALLLSTTHQALHLRQPQEGLRFVQLGLGVAADRSHRLSAATASNLALFQALCHGRRGDVRACDRAIGEAIAHFADADPAKAAPWVAHVSPAELAAKQGHAWYTLALTTADAAYAAKAVPLLQQAVDSFGPAYARSRAINLPGLAGARAITGDLDTAVHIGHQAVDEITALASPRLHDRLRTLDTVLQPHRTRTAVGEVRHRIRAALIAA